MLQPRTGRRLVFAALVAGLGLASPASARVPGVPYLDNESIGLFRSLAEATAAPADAFDEDQWALETITNLTSSGDGMGPGRYLIAFSAYAIAHAARQTPAWREPYRVALDGSIARMLQPVAWRDWLEVWKRPSPLGPDNIMYTGHLVHMMTLYRHLFNDRKYEQPTTLTYDDGRTFETDVRSLSQAIAAQAAGNVDTAGQHFYGVACEPGRVFVPCNTPHRANQLLFDRIYGTDLSSSNGAWVDWVKANMVHADTGVLSSLYWPFGANQQTPTGQLPRRDEGLDGIYNAWSIWLLQAVDPTWAAELYPPFKAYFLRRGAESVYDDGRPVIMDRVGGSGLQAQAASLLATGFGLVLAHLFDDRTTYDELSASWITAFGEAQWSDDGASMSYRRVIYPRVFQNTFPLLARTTTPDSNPRSVATDAWSEKRFEQPFIERLGDERAFVNQAFYDEATQRLVITVNGGRAVTGAMDVVVARWPAGADPVVRRDGKVWSDWRQENGRLVIHTAPLSAQEESYVVEPGTPGACGCAGPGVGALGTLVACLATALATRRRRA